MEKILLVVGVVALAVFITAFFIMWGWSWFMVPVFKMAPLTFTQAFGFSILAHSFGKSCSSSK